MAASLPLLVGSDAGEVSRSNAVPSRGRYAALGCFSMFAESLTNAGLLGALGLLLGAMALFATVVAPTVFRALDGDTAGMFLRALFPRYYLWCAVVAALASLLAVATAPGIALGLGAVLVLFLYARQGLMPRINASRDAAQRGKAGALSRFRRLHALSVFINAVQMLLLVAFAILLAI